LAYFFIFRQRRMGYSGMAWHGVLGCFFLSGRDTPSSFSDVSG
jgi:hypothetical protein